MLPQLLDGDSRLEIGDAGRGIEAQDLIHLGQVQAEALRVDGRVPVAAARSAQAHRASGSRRLREDFADGLHRPRTEHAPVSSPIHAPALHVFVGVGGRWMAGSATAHDQMLKRLKMTEGMDFTTAATSAQRQGT